MRCVVQRVSSASVAIDGSIVGQIGAGLLVLLGIAPADTEADALWLAEKICALRLFPDAEGKMNLSLRDLAPSQTVGAALRRDSASDSQPSMAPLPAASASDSQLSALNSQLPPPLLVVSQFTLFASTRKGTRPSFNAAAKPDHAIPLYESFIRHATAALGRPVATGRFGAAMSVALVNDGPVTLLLDSHTRD